MATDKEVKTEAYQILVDVSKSPNLDEIRDDLGDVEVTRRLVLGRGDTQIVISREGKIAKRLRWLHYFGDFAAVNMAQQQVREHPDCWTQTFGEGYKSGMAFYWPVLEYLFSDDVSLKTFRRVTELGSENSLELLLKYSEKNHYETNI